VEEELSVETIKSKSVRGIVVLTGRTFLLQIIALVAQLLLFAYLGKYEFGVFAIVSAIINFLVYFSDIGLAAALIQKKEKPSDLDLKTTFTVQQVLILIPVVVVLVLTPFFVQKYSLTNDGRMLLYALCASVVMSSLKSIPSILLERKLEFVKLVFPQIIEQLLYNVVLVVMAMNGFGVSSFSVAVLIRGFAGLVLVYYLEPWKPGFAFSRESLKGLFKFGIPYQVNTFLSTLKDDGMVIVLGSVIGPAGVGVLSFAQKLARLPLTFFMDTVTKVTFPAFSRLQNEKEHLERSVTRSIFFICLLVFPSLMGIIILSPLLVRVVPRYEERWLTALIPIIFISINFAFASATTQLTNLLNAIGKIKITFYLMIMWTVLTWALVPILGSKFGVVGASIGYALVGSSSIVAIVIAKRYVNFSISDSIIKPLIGTMVMGAVLLLVRNFLDISINSMLVLGLIGVLVYGSSMVSMMGASLIDDAKKSFKTIFNR
jgi:O-antigen/teichoic acid export membrane protein